MESAINKMRQRGTTFQPIALGTGKVKKRRISKGRFLRGDLVFHVIRGRAVFEHYCSDDSECSVNINGESCRVSSVLVTHRAEGQETRLPSAKEVEAMTDDEIGVEYVHWFRIGRNEDGLKGEERKHLQRIAAEYEKRQRMKHRHERQIRDRD